MSNCEEVQSKFSDFYDDAIDADEKRRVSGHIGQCPVCAESYRSFVRTLDVIQTIPDAEPALDLWPEFSVKMDEVLAEQKLSPLTRVQRYWDHLLATLSEGAILYTSSVAHRTCQRFSKYLIRDPFSTE